MIYFIADLHFDDENIIAYENRPFDHILEMNENLIHNWNSVVSKDDEVYVLGDFVAEGRNLVFFLENLNGRKYLVKGNHDAKSNSYYRRAGFYEVYDKPIILNDFWILSHEPLYMNTNMPYANIFGHIHNSPLYKDYSSHHFCVTVERINYTPISFDEIKKKVMEGKSNV